VLTSGCEYKAPLDSSLISDVPPDTEIFTTYRPNEKRALEGQFGRRNIIVDAFLPWIPVAYEKVRKIIKKHKVDVVFTTSPPHSQQLIGLLLKWTTGIPWIADFRDPWTSDQRFMKYKSKFQIAVEKSLEKLVLKNADAVISTTRGADESFFRKGGRPGDRSKFVCIPNGYDPEEYEDLQPTDSGRLIFSHIGSAGPLISDPSYFFKALRALLDEEPELGRTLSVKFAGGLDPGMRKLMRDLNLDGIVEFVGFHPHKEAIRMIQNSHVLLLFELPVKFGDGPTRVIPSKVFEYMGASRPIMPMVIEGDTANILRESGTANILAPTDIEGIKKRIRKFVFEFEKGTLKSGVPPPAEFSRVEQAKRLACIMHEIKRKHAQEKT